MFIDLYSTDYGDVRVSPDEAMFLNYADRVQRSERVAIELPAEMHRRILAKATAIREACERFARAKAGAR